MIRHTRDVTDSATPRLSREAIIACALERIDDDGLAGLSMRNLAKALDVEAMSLYRYVNGREDLLEGVVDVLMTGLTAALRDARGDSWQRFMQVTAHEVRRVAVEHPRAFPLIATRHPAAPWLRPPLRSVEVVEIFLASLIDFGFSDQQAVDAYRAFSSFLLGQLLLEAAVRGAETGPIEEPLDEGDADLPQGDGEREVDDLPQVMRLRPLLSEDRADEEFEVALESLLDRLDREMSQ
ncbi:TetR/AcrR family transcriptional regulator C-terminal domain-containing protein [Microbacterium sp. KSW2-21]|uniref:TetR/AcrR family transcriptional regulator C-terminal domain-containing protein n=1 Tax=Microbacterium algihabitans TaxID=3075992 RepID=A0ABU3RUH7_9MICO|nr:MULTISPECIES: TetR/AcrR family transcriptional regulator C-terminal domain-containing protein [unclassified Microbacterium]MDU0326478.1 TetR/AcrR family transcriptional regulator C-terminal domain-containing protein [Microbacterium sp. KSW2-21]